MVVGIIAICAPAGAAPPGPPGGLTTVEAFERIRVSWTSMDAMPPVARYEVEFQSRAHDTAGPWAAGGWAQVATVDAVSAEHRVWHTGLNPDLRYRYRVRAVNADGAGAWSAAFPAAGEQPRPGAALLDATVAPGEITLTWGMASSSSVTRWEFQRSSDGQVWGIWTAIAGSDQTTVSHTVGSLTDGTMYWFRVRAVNGAGPGAQSNTVSATPGTPNRVRFGAASYTADEGDDAGATVEVLLSRAASTTRRIPITVTPQAGAEATDYTVTGLTGGVLEFAPLDTRKTFSVRAEQDADASNEQLLLGFGLATALVGTPRTATVTFDDDDNVPPKPTPAENNLRAWAGWGRIRMTWGSVTGAKAHQIHFQTRAWDASVWPADESSWQPGPAAIIAGDIVHHGTDPDLRYRYRLRGGNDAGFGPWSDPFPPGGVLPLPTSPVFTATQGERISDVVLSWQDGPASAVEWWYSYSNDGGETYRGDTAIADDERYTMIPGGGTVRSYTVSGLVRGNYLFRLRAKNADDYGRPSNPVPVTLGVPLVVSFGAAEYSAPEGGAAVTVTVRMAPAADRLVRVPIAVTGEADPADYTVTGLSGGALNFNSGDVVQSFEIAANQDLDSEHETLELAFGALPAEVTAGATSRATLTLTDDEPVPPRLTQGLGATSQPEGVRVTWTGVQVASPVIGYEVQYQRRGPGDAQWPEGWLVVHTPSAMTGNDYSFEASRSGPRQLVPLSGAGGKRIRLRNLGGHCRRRQAAAARQPDADRGDRRHCRHGRAHLAGGSVERHPLGSQSRARGTTRVDRLEEHRRQQRQHGRARRHRAQRQRRLRIPSAGGKPGRRRRALADGAGNSAAAACRHVCRCIGQRGRRRHRHAARNHVAASGPGRAAADRGDTRERDGCVGLHHHRAQQRSPGDRLRHVVRYNHHSGEPGRRSGRTSR